MITLHADSNATLDIAELREVWSIGYNLDNTKNYPNTFLTAPVWAWEYYYEPYILKCLQGKNIGINYWEGAETGVVSLAPLSKHVDESTAAYINEELRKMQQDYYDVFYGPIKDNTGRIRIKSGENISDEALTQLLDWYVEGVVIDE